MTLSNELQSQLTRFSKTRSCSLESQLKNELALILFQINGKRLNKSCGTCVRNAMQDVLNFISHEVRLESFIGVRHERANAVRPETPDSEEMAKEAEQVEKTLKELEQLSYADLKKYAGIKGNIKREKIYQLIHLSK
jgi:hypothetical protein